PRVESTPMNNSCQALCRTLVTQNGLQPEHVDISQSVLYTSIMGLLLVTDKERELQLGSGQVGLCNVGNTCFLNAIVQCLSHTRGLRDYCLMKAYLQDKHSNQEPVLMNEFSKVLAALWECDSGDNTVNPGKFYAFLKRHQQDAQEFLRFLLDRLHTEINRCPSQRPAVIPNKEPTYSRFRISEEAFAMWQKHLDRDDSKIVDLFSGQLHSSLHCSICSHYSNTFDVFCDLSLPVPKKSEYGRIVTLKECLDLFSQEEKLDKENSPMCERCNRRTESTKRPFKGSLESFINIELLEIICDLNRFTMSRYSICKSSVTVSFPLTGLDLGPFGPVDCGPVLYDLYAVCSHSGTVNMGHYTAVCREEEGWCCYNDSCVSTIQEEKLQSNQAYVLFYELKSYSFGRK
ncbi:putative ubiquitin carboxyl-terminal hydrolase 21-like, partial [Triplophysa rosa]